MPRDGARLFVYERSSRRRSHLKVRDLVDLLGPKDLLVLNDTRVLPYRLTGRRATGGRVEVLLLGRDGDDARGYVRPARKVRPGDTILIGDGQLVLTATEDLGHGKFRFRLVAPGGDLEQVLEEVGRAPLPPYIRRSGDEDPRADRERYQTVYARVPGAGAAPTAGLHFTEDLLARLRAKGVGIGCVTLHVGEGTFAPIRAEVVEEHAMHEEEFVLPEAVAAQIARARAGGGRVVAVGTTSARVLETCAAEDGTVAPGAGRTSLFLYPGCRLRVVDALMTNFHLPESTLLMLVSAFAGRSEVLELYREAVDLGYRFYSYGDSMLLL